MDASLKFNGNFSDRMGVMVDIPASTGFQGLPTVVADFVLDDETPHHGPTTTAVKGCGLPTTTLRHPSNFRGTASTADVPVPLSTAMVPRVPPYSDCVPRMSSPSEGTTALDGRNGGRAPRGGKQVSIQHSSPCRSSVHQFATRPNQFPIVAPLEDDAKRKKNREAAARCRQRKSERVFLLEEKAKQLKMSNEQLEQEAMLLQNQIAEIQNSLVEHMNSGCPIRLMP